MRIRVLVENTGNEFVEGEHGLSLMIEYEGEKYLLDAGSTSLFMTNAEKLGEEILDISKCILSHGHYDHSGGFAEYLSKNGQATLYMMETAIGEYYSGSGGNIHYIGLSEELVKNFKEQFSYVRKCTQLAPGVMIVPHQIRGLDKIGERAKLYRKENEYYVPDDFAHEMSLVFETEKGLVICNSCSHAGASNIIREVQEALSEKSVYAFIGGLHLKGLTLTEEEVSRLCESLKGTGLKYLYTGHCTGEAAFQLLKRHMGAQVEALYSGKEILL